MDIYTHTYMALNSDIVEIIETKEASSKTKACMEMPICPFFTDRGWDTTRAWLKG